MKRFAAFVIGAFTISIVACGGSQKPSPQDPKAEVQQLIRLYEEARPKFVVQKEEMIKADDCDRATRLRTAIDEMAAEAAMSPENSDTITKVQMELQQAERDCLAK